MYEDLASYVFIIFYDLLLAKREAASNTDACFVETFRKPVLIYFSLS